MEPWRVINENSSNRSLAGGLSRYLDGAKTFQYALAPEPSLGNPLCVRVNSCESPRAPPLMDPPILC